MTRPKISLLVPICNVESYLEGCLKSAVKQTLEDIEIICIDDGSTDGSARIIDKFASADDRFKVISKPNSGYGDSMNCGLDIAQGEYISILESDDILDSDGLEYMYDQANAADLDVFKCNFWMFWSTRRSENANRINYYFPAISSEMIEAGVHRSRDIPEIFWVKPSIWSAIYRKEFLDDNGIRFLATPGASFQDAAFTFKVFACAERVAYSGRAFLRYRQDNENSSVNSKGKVYCTCDEHAEMKRFLEMDRPDLKAELDPIRAYMKYLNYNWNYDRLSAECKLDFLLRYRDELNEEIALGNIPTSVPSMPLPDGSSDICYFNQLDLNRINSIIDDPVFYNTQRMCETNGGGRAETLRRYFRAGGVNYIFKVIKMKRQRDG